LKLLLDAHHAEVRSATVESMAEGSSR
jgi:hypothetical protein